VSVIRLLLTISNPCWVRQGGEMKRKYYLGDLGVDVK
jgi:hypothetical protein